MGNSLCAILRAWSIGGKQRLRMTGFPQREQLSRVRCALCAGQFPADIDVLYFLPRPRRFAKESET